MKLYFACVLCLTFSTVNCDLIWKPGDILEVINVNTNRMTSYVKEKGNEFRSKLYGYVPEVVTTPAPVEVREDVKKTNTLFDTFGEYLNNARVSGRKFVDTVTFSNVNVECPEYNPDVYLTTPQLIVKYGYSAESHTIKTEDGYLVTLHRIPRGKNDSPGSVSKKTVFLHHGLLGSSADWIMTGPQQGLAFILADAGYDVWLGNVRGNTYSRSHITYSIDSYEFWNFTWHEVGYYDLPAAIDYINDLKTIDNKIHYIGHSMGTTILFVLLSTRPEYNKKLRAGYALAPVAYMSEIRSPIKLLAPIAHDLESIIKLFGANEFLPQNFAMTWLSRYLCEFNHYEKAICENSMFVLCGHDKEEFNSTLLPVILGHVPAGASTKTLVHYAQEIQAKGNFQQFDYGKEGNLKQYGTEFPPEYSVSDITLPIALFSAENDWLSGVKDVDKLYKKLGNPLEHYIIPMKEFNHIDFLWAIHAPKLVYSKLLELMADNRNFEKATIFEVWFHKQF